MKSKLSPSPPAGERGSGGEGRSFALSTGFAGRLKFLPLIAIAIAAIAGCSKPHDLYPLKVGNQWQYTANNHLGVFLHTVKVTRETPTPLGMGYELRGSLGDSIVVWDGPILRATVLSGTRFNPPLPLLDSTRAEAELSWKGRMHSAGKTLEATATLKQTNTEWGTGNKVKATQTDLTIRSAERTVTVTTIYVRSRGPVSQTQHVSIANGQPAFEVSLEHLNGP